MTNKAVKNTRNICLSKSAFLTACVIFLSLPVLLFFCFYLRPLFAFLFSVPLIIINYLFYKNTKTDSDALSNKISLSPVKIVVIVLFSLLICFISGIGEFVWSSYDHLVRWATLNDMVQYKWPIIYDLSTQQNEVVHNYLGDGNRAFSYYLTYWVVPALIGKIGGLFVARIALLIWSSIGLSLVLLGILFVNRNHLRIILPIFLFFGSFDFIPYLIQDHMGLEVTNPEAWNQRFVVNGTFDQLMNVFNQCIPCWIAVIVLMLSKNNKSIGLIGALLFAYSPWATIGIVPIALYYFVSNSKNKSKLFFDLLHINNWLLPVISIVVFGSFFTMNASAVSQSGFAWQVIPDIKSLLLKYIGYVIVEFGIWLVVLFKKHKTNPLYWILIGEVLIFPIYQITEFNDLLMRGTIAPIFIVTIWVINHVDISLYEVIKKNKLELTNLVLPLLIFICSLTQLLLISTSVVSTFTSPEMSESRRHDINSFGNINDERYAYLADYQFLIKDYDSSFFFKYLAKK